jgi:hypothetical protein
MSVYKEGYFIVDAIEKASKQIYPDACDYGVLVNKKDKFWNMAKQLADWYGVKETRKHNKYGTGESVSIDIELLDEWAVSDKRKTEKQALDKFRLEFCTVGNKPKGYYGLITIHKEAI